MNDVGGGRRRIVLMVVRVNTISGTKGGDCMYIVYRREPELSVFVGVTDESGVTEYIWSDKLWHGRPFISEVQAAQLSKDITHIKTYVTYYRIEHDELKRKELTAPHE